MRRDLSLMRDILLYIEAIPDGRHIESSEIEVEGKNEAEISHACGLLFDEDLILGHELTSVEDTPDYYIKRLTSRGHSYLDSIRDEAIWKKVITEAKKQGGSLPFKIIEALALDLVRRAVLGN